MSFLWYGIAFCILFASCDSDPNREQPPEDLPDIPTFRPDTTYNRSLVSYTTFDNLDAGYHRGNYAIAYKFENDQGQSATLFQKVARNWSSSSTVQNNSNWFIEKPAQSSPRTKNISIPFALTSKWVAASPIYLYRKQFQTNLTIERNVVLFEQQEMDAMQSSYLLFDKEEHVSAIHYLQLSDNTVLVGFQPETEELNVPRETAARIYKWEGQSWVMDQEFNTGTGKHGRLIGDQLLLWQDGSTVQAFEKGEATWQQIYTFSVPPAEKRVSSDHHIFVITQNDSFRNEIQLFERATRTWSEVPFPDIGHISSITSIDTDGDFLALGSEAHFESQDCGIVYLYERVRESWVEVDALQPGQTINTDSIETQNCGSFGRFVSIDDGTLVVSDFGRLHFFSWSD